MQAYSVESSRGSPKSTREASQSTTSAHDDHADRRFLEHEHVPDYFLGGDTPSRSLTSEKVELLQDGMDPSQSSPCSTYDTYNATHNTNNDSAPTEKRMIGSQGGLRHLGRLREGIRKADLAVKLQRRVTHIAESIGMTACSCAFCSVASRGAYVGRFSIGHQAVSGPSSSEPG
ncbi:uncharacterized protein M421DRAFT_419513 [Didymella exigua CBS 183.55]|uniref:Uncharacterized protein n=1 Tax=Didymella exigua CBS 183.55 TaxID=1150837 RepID=A0A6A5RTT0_9PLEO|nr:uncharacterized protein M421DRAFT_419513 [Didymella exigua CBS 183.55]KAF1929726.1 hypothetical protein M421DRAFT_419513 [Didymella exigua CBS 183.55]